MESKKNKKWKGRGKHIPKGKTKISNGLKCYNKTVCAGEKAQDCIRRAWKFRAVKGRNSKRYTDKEAKEKRVTTIRPILKGRHDQERETEKTTRRRTQDTNKRLTKPLLKYCWFGSLYFTLQSSPLSQSIATVSSSLRLHISIEMANHSWVNKVMEFEQSHGVFSPEISKGKTSWLVDYIPRWL